MAFHQRQSKERTSSEKPLQRYKKVVSYRTQLTVRDSTATVTSCDRRHGHCRPHVVILTETELYPTTIYCRDGCPPRQKKVTRPVKVTKTVTDFEVITIESICTK